MQTADMEKEKRIWLYPGECYISNQNIIISTLLGSCISACLYDPIQRIIGMNHFLLSYEGHEKDEPVCDIDPGKYGTCAMELLIDKMLELGACYENLHAKVFGGGSMFKPFDECRISSYCVGNANIIFIREFLKKSGIRLAAEDLGGETGRLVHFLWKDGSVYVRKIKKFANVRLAQRDAALWKKILENQEQGVSAETLWQNAVKGG